MAEDAGERRTRRDVLVRTITRRQALGYGLTGLAGLAMSSLTGLLTRSRSAYAEPASAKLSATNAQAGEFLVYVGTETAKGAKGIYLYHFEVASGELEALGLAAEAADPEFLAIHPQGRFLYAATASRDGSVNAFAIALKTGQLNFLNRESSQGAIPCHLSVDHTGRFVLVANYGSGSVAILPIRDDGSVGKATDVVQHHGSGADPKRQAEPHPHSITPSPDNRFALVADLGLDRIMIYRLDVSVGRLPPNDPPWATLKPASGPRHLAFHPSRRFVYVINELSNTMTAFTWNASRGALEEVQTTSTLPAGFGGASYGADVHPAPSGRFLYGSNRGHDSIAIFAIDERAGTLATVGYQPALGKWPVDFAIDPTGAWLLVADQQSDSIVVFHIDPNTGQLSPTAHAVTVSKPACVKFLPAG